eukprot:4747950-Amphidinium_carterae.1
MCATDLNFGKIDEHLDDAEGMRYKLTSCAQKPAYAALRSRTRLPTQLLSATGHAHRKVACFTIWDANEQYKWAYE